MYKVSFYTPAGKTSPIENVLESLNLRQEAKIARAFRYLKEFGLTRAIPNLRKLTNTPLWELRILGKDNIRIICTTRKAKEIVILHIFIKKKKKTPKKELDMAMNRYRFLVDN